MTDRLNLLEERLAAVNGLSLASDLPDAIITESGLKITPLDAAVPESAQAGVLLRLLSSQEIRGRDS